MDFLKKHKSLVIFIAIIVVLIIIVSAVIVTIVSSNDDVNEKYGNRLAGIESVEISDARLETVETKLLENKNANAVSYNISGRIIKFFIQVKSETDALSVENMLNTILDNFTLEEKDFYDFAAYITNEKEEELYPMLAYKHHSNQIFTITKKVGGQNEK